MWTMMLEERLLLELDSYYLGECRNYLLLLRLRLLAFLKPDDFFNAQVFLSTLFFLYTRRWAVRWLLTEQRGEKRSKKKILKIN